MLAIHVDDGLDNPVATENLKKLVAKTGVTMVTIQPDMEEYRDILRSLLKGSLPNLAIAQDNLIIKSLQDYAEQQHIRYSLPTKVFWSVDTALMLVIKSSFWLFKKNLVNVLFDI